MGGLRKRLPITFSFSIIVMLARIGVPPLASFFSKELIIDSLGSTGNVFLTVTIYATTALTFAYTLRFIILVYLRDQSTHLKKIHLHEPSKTMLFSSGMLATLCVCLGLFAGYVAKFMHTNVEIGINQIFSPSTLFFAVILFLGGSPIYLAYYRKSPSIEKVWRIISLPMTTVLAHGYFFDDFYERVVAKELVRASEDVKRVEVIIGRLPYFFAKGVIGISHAIEKHVEKAIFERIPQQTARAAIDLAYITHKYFDVLVDELLYIAAKRTLAFGSKIEKTHNHSLQRYIAAALLGFLIVLILVIITILRGK
jgi:NADH:ubiquinone oxidoreductase subunit 5 (subunit L)/multisubunit Na+/H+ antiporter MnhA subunit